LIYTPAIAVGRSFDLYSLTLVQSGNQQGGNLGGNQQGGNYGGNDDSYGVGSSLIHIILIIHYYLGAL
jgi:hypothetical protein